MPNSTISKLFSCMRQQFTEQRSVQPLKTRDPHNDTFIRTQAVSTTLSALPTLHPLPDGRTPSCAPSNRRAGTRPSSTGRCGIDHTASCGWRPETVFWRRNGTCRLPSSWQAVHWSARQHLQTALYEPTASLQQIHGRDVAKAWLRCSIPRRDCSSPCAAANDSSDIPSSSSAPRDRAHTFAFSVWFQSNCDTNGP